MLVKTYASAVEGIDAQTITIEVSTGGQITQGKPGYNLVGLPDNAVKEGFWRIETALPDWLKHHQILPGFQNWVTGPELKPAFCKIFL